MVTTPTKLTALAKRQLRGIRDRIPSGYLLGRVDPGDGEVQLIRLKDIQTGAALPPVHAAVTLAGTPDYITISGQVITRGLIDLTADVTGDLPVAEGGTGASTAADARTNLDVDIAGTDNSTDVTLAGTPDYITITGQVITRGLIDLTADVTGDLPVAEGGTGSSTAADARTALGVDPIGTDNSTDVTLAGTPDYITITGQVITRGLIDLTADVTGDLPVAEGGTGASDAATARTNLGLGTAAIKDTGTSGGTVPLLDGVNTWSGIQVMGTDFDLGGNRLDLDADNDTSVRESADDVLTWEFGGIDIYVQDASGTTQTRSGIIRHNMVGSGQTRLDMADTAATTALQRFSLTCDNGLFILQNRNDDGTFQANHTNWKQSGGTVLQGASGGDPGAGKLNGADLEINGTTVCYPLEKFLTGSINQAAWNHRAPDRYITDEENERTYVEVLENEPMKRFEAMSNVVDVFDIDVFWGFVEANSHLPTMPAPDVNDADPNMLSNISLGDTLPRILETLEIQAIHIKKLNDRIKLLERKPNGVGGLH